MDKVIESFINQCDNMMIAEEGIILTEKDLYINFDNWKKEKNNNILFITGLPSSGKTTLSRKIANDNDAELFELDDFYKDNDSSKNIFLTKYKKLYPNEKIDSIALYKFLLWLIQEMKSSPNILYIIEGFQLYDLELSSDFINSFPWIIKGTSVFSSSIRGIQREMDSGINIKTLFHLVFKDKIIIHQYQDNSKLNKFKTNIS